MFNVLIVEDSEVYKKVETKLFSEFLDFEIFHSNSVKNAKKVVDSYKIDIVLLDINLEDGDGRELLKYIRQEKKNNEIYIIVITSQVADSFISGIYDMGIDYYLPKPFNPLVLRATVKRIYSRASTCSRS